MIKISVFYPNSHGCKFDMAYYLKHHMPLVQRLLGGALKGMAVEEGLAGGAPGVPPSYVAMGHLLFESVEAYQSSFGPNADEILNDIPNYSNVQPTIQISEVKL
jgi:uncharacterized protein (TIGR02118 family)